MPRDPAKVKARKLRYLDRLKAEKYGADAVGRDMRGRHGGHRTGENHQRWSGQRRITSHGYVAVRVALDHPHGWGPLALKRFKYAYEHTVVMMAKIGRSLLPDEVVHHRNGIRTDNRLENLELTTTREHQRHHSEQTRDRDSLGRFI